MRNSLLTLLYLLIPTACSSIEELRGSEPIIDRQGVNPAQYRADLDQCEDYADEAAIAWKAGTGAVSGAVVGAVFGAVVGDSDTAKKGAGIGAVGGGTRGAGEGIRERERVIRRCLSGRGYRVLN